jgi:hypothetical protein
MSDEYGWGRRIKWGTKETSGLTQRMALRLLKNLEWFKRASTKEREQLLARDVKSAGFGFGITRRPSWFPEKRWLAEYDDSWTDWTVLETNLLVARMLDGVKPNALFKVFEPPHDIAADAYKKATGKTYRATARNDTTPIRSPRTKAGKRVGGSVPVIDSKGLPAGAIMDMPGVVDSLSDEDMEYVNGEFAMIDIENPIDRIYANRRWELYSERVDLEKPANQTTVKLMILLEVQIRRIMWDCNDLDPESRKESYETLERIRKAFSRAATDVAQLEKQYIIEPEQDSLDAVIERTHDYRQNWRDRQIEHEMGIRNLYEMYEKFHKTQLEGTEEDTVSEVDIPQPKPQRNRGDVAGHIMEKILARTDGDAQIVVDG